MESKVKCSGCKKDITQQDKYVCKNCQLSTYCSAQCSESHWDVHQVNCVLIWAFPTATIGEFIEMKRDDLGLLRKALKAVGLLDVLKDSTKTFTLFAPTNAAVSHASSFTKDLTMEQLKDVLLYHVHVGAINAENITGKGKLKMYDGKKVVYELEENGRITLNGSIHVTQKQLVFKNGVVHVIDGVLIPPNLIPAIDR